MAARVGAVGGSEVHRVAWSKVQFVKMVPRRKQVGHIIRKVAKETLGIFFFFLFSFRLIGSRFVRLCLFLIGSSSSSAYFERAIVVREYGKGKRRLTD